MDAAVLDWLRIGREMGEKRVAAKIGMRDFAAEMGITPVVLSHMEHGRADPDEYWKARTS